MRTALLTTLLALGLLATPLAAPQTLLQRVSMSVVKTYEPDAAGECTAFSVHPGRYLTADHCVQGAKTLLVVAGELKAIGTVLYENAEHDLAVFDCEDILKPGLALGKKPSFGEPLLAIGYGLDAPVPIFFDLAAIGEFEPFENVGPRLVMNHALVPGMSGGPVVNQAGEFVTVAQVSSPHFGLSGGVTYDHLKALLKKY